MKNDTECTGRDLGSMLQNGYRSLWFRPRAGAPAAHPALPPASAVTPATLPWRRWTPMPSPRIPTYEIVFGIIQRDCAPCHTESDDEGPEDARARGRARSAWHWAASSPTSRPARAFVASLTDIEEEISKEHDAARRVAAAVQRRKAHHRALDRSTGRWHRAREGDVHCRDRAQRRPDGTVLPRRQSVPRTMRRARGVPATTVT